MPQLSELDIAGNQCQLFGAESLKEAILSHAALKSKRYSDYIVYNRTE